MFKFNLLLFVVFSGVIFSAESLDLLKKEDKNQQKQCFEEDVISINKERQKLAQISEALGHMVGRNFLNSLNSLNSSGLQLDIAKLVQGFHDEAAGRASPMSENECMDALAVIQEEALKKISISNLEQANQFLLKNGCQSGIQIILPGKLQYRVDKEGVGAAVNSYCSPLVRYVGKCLDGTIFSSSQEGEVIYLDETIEGFKQGVTGMKEGEKRVLYIHPDLGYGTKGMLPPNSLLTFEIEVIKADAPQSKPLDILTVPSSKNLKVNPEIAQPLENQQIIR